MARVAVDIDDEAGPQRAAQDVEGPDAEDEPRSRKRRRPEVDPVEVELAREETKRVLIEVISKVVIVVLYMAFTLLRDRDTGVVVVDEGDKGAADDWEE